MSKVTLRQCLSRLRELGDAPRGSVSRGGRTYRSGFKRAMGAVAFIFIYFLLASQVLGDGQASSDNTGIFVLLLFALLAGVAGAFFAPRINAFFYARTVQGRRHHSSKSHTHSRKSRKEPGDSRSRAEPVTRTRALEGPGNLSDKSRDPNDSSPPEGHGS